MVHANFSFLRISLIVAGLLVGLIFPRIGSAQPGSLHDSLQASVANSAKSAKDSTQGAKPLFVKQPSLTGHYLKLLGITLLLLFLFWVSMKYMRKLQFGNEKYKNTRITVLSRQYLTSKHSIWLVVIGGQKYLLGVTDHAINLIDRLGEASEQELNQSKQMSLPSFGTFLEKLRKK